MDQHYVWCLMVGSVLLDDVQHSLTVAYMESENMCQVITIRDRYPHRVKAPVFLVIHMFLMVKARESVGMRAKPAVRPRKFAVHKRYMTLQKKWSFEYDIQNFWFQEQIAFDLKVIIGCYSLMTVLSCMDIMVCGKSW